MSLSRSSLASWSSVGGLAKANPSNIDSPSDGLEVEEVPNYCPFGVSSVLSYKDLEILHLRHQIPLEFKLEAFNPMDQIPLPPYGLVGLYEESLKVGLRLPLNFFIIELLRAYEIPPIA